jgi:hypothetical protein
MAHVKLRTTDDVNPDLITNWLRQARELELQAESLPPSPLTLD